MQSHRLFPNGETMSLNDLYKVVASVIFTASAQHAAVNFPQKSLESYAPAYPLALYASPPDDGNATETS